MFQTTNQVVTGKGPYLCWKNRLLIARFRCFAEIAARPKPMAAPSGDVVHRMPMISHDPAW